MLHKLVLIRHGESEWNKANKFTGWTDVNLTDRGREEGKWAGDKLKEEGYKFDVVYTSVLQRAICTASEIMARMKTESLPVKKDYRLNERHYGALQGLNKAETVAEHGEDMVKIWRRSYKIPPPALTLEDPRHPAKDPLYKGLDPSVLPSTEALINTVERVVPLWQNELEPLIRLGKNVLISAHGNSIRALIKHIDNVSESDIMELNIPTGVPLVYEFDENMKAVNHFYLMNDEDLKARIEEVAAQGKAKPAT